MDWLQKQSTTFFYFLAVTNPSNNINKKSELVIRNFSLISFIEII